MKLSLVLCAAALALTLPAHALAACDKADVLLAKAYPQAKKVDAGLVVERDYLQAIDPDTVACKPWPFKPELTLVAVPLLEASPAVDGERKGDVEIIIADTATGRPVARRIEKGMAFSDAIQFNSSGLTLDTARYDVKPGQRAFGLRTSQSGSSRVNPFSEEALWLYIYENGRIERVLDGLIVERDNGENNGDCDGTTTTVKRTVTVGGNGTAGYRDLAVDQTSTSGVSKKAVGDCKSTETPGPSKHVLLHVADGHYQPPLGVKARSAGNDGEPDLFSDITVDAAKH